MINITDIEHAAAQLAPYIHRTPLLSSRTLAELVGAPAVRLKAENLQRAGAFKIRGAMNKLLSLTSAERARGVVAFSSGNHAQGVALAASLLNISATIVMPEDALPLKVQATKAYGAEVVQSGVNAATRSTVAAEIVARTGAVLVPPFDDPYIIAGQGTIGLEIFDEWPDVDTVVVPLGGGGLIAGITYALTERKPGIRIYGVEPAAGNDGQQSLRSGAIVTIEPPQTIADGARTTAIGKIPFEVLRTRAQDIVTVNDEALLAAVRFLAMRGKLVVEPTGALAVAALLTAQIPNPGNTAVIISGGNIAPQMLVQALTLTD